MIENYYSNNLYQIISDKLRFFLGWINLPIGDIIYLFSLAALLYFIIVNIKKPKILALNLSILLFSFVILFYTLWGFNYKRISIKNHLNIDVKFEKKELIAFTENLIKDINKLHIDLFYSESVEPKNKYSFEEIVQLSKNNPKSLKFIFEKEFIIPDYKSISVKKSLFSLPLTYMGFSGYINPFTNEANINYKIPSSSLIFVINHEIAHQLGIASEKDANFIAYLMLVNNENDYFKFCGYSYALKLCLNEILKIDSDKYEYLIRKVNKGIIKDFKETAIFWKKYEGKIEDVSKNLYDKYLKQNDIDSGIKNYNESISLILGYNKKLNDKKNNKFRK
tara:strand:+ start:124 stop:1131 length:1008 start_codon:yes stop_codon:yes gene_type:complete